MLTDMHSEMEKHRDECFAIKLNDHVACGMNLTEISITFNGNTCSMISLKNNEIKKLIEALQKHIA